MSGPNNEDDPMSDPQQSTSGEPNPRRRATENILVDPTTGQEISNPKRPKLDLDKGKKVKVLLALINAYKKIAKCFNLEQEAKTNLNISYEITRIMNNIHIVEKAAKNGITSNVANKSKSNSLTITTKGQLYSALHVTVGAAWASALTAQGLVYKKYDTTDKDNWIGTMSSYLKKSGAFRLRLNELRLGHGVMPISTADGRIKAIPVHIYGLFGMHHVLLEGVSYPPERRSFMAQRVGPMTAFLCMLRSHGQYRKKWADVVKRAMSMISCIDDIIEVTENQNRPEEVSNLVTLLAEILLITTSSHATIMYFPMCMLIRAYELQTEANKQLFLEKFNCSGDGDYYTYKSVANVKWSIEGEYTPEQAAQVAFHSLFGTYKEDLSILARITNHKTWFNREELADCFKKTSHEAVEFEMPKLKYYPKLSSANQTALSSGVYSQVSVQPVFSGRRIQRFNDEFFEHIRKKQISQGRGRTLTQLVVALSNILEDIQEVVRDKRELIIGTTSWKETASLTLTTDGNEVENRFTGHGIFFMGKKP